MSNLEDYGLSPEEIASFKEEQKKQERLYNEYKQSGRWQKDFPDGLNPTIFSEELISSIPEDEYKELCAAYKKIEKQVWMNPKLWLVIGISVSILIFCLYKMISVFFA